MRRVVLRCVRRGSTYVRRSSCSRSAARASRTRRRRPASSAKCACTATTPRPMPTSSASSATSSASRPPMQLIAEITGQARTQRPLRRRRGAQALSIDRESRRHPADDRRRRSARHRSARSHAGPMKKFWSSGMFMPILHSEDGYGFTYGARISFVDRLGPRSRITVPLTWGGERQARVQLERAFKSGPIERIAGEFGIRPPRESALRDRRPRASVSARASNRRRRGGCASAPAGRRDDVQFGDVEDTVVALRRRRDDRHPRRSGVSAQRHPRHVRHRAREIRCRRRQPEEGRRARLRRAVRADGAGRARPERHHRQRRCRPTSTTCSAAPRTCAATRPATRPATTSPPRRPSFASRSPRRSTSAVSASRHSSTGARSTASARSWPIRPSSAALAAASISTSPSSACRSTSPDRESRRHPLPLRHGRHIQIT